MLTRTQAYAKAIKTRRSKASCSQRFGRAKEDSGPQFDGTVTESTTRPARISSTVTASKLSLLFLPSEVPQASLVPRF